MTATDNGKTKVHPTSITLSDLDISTVWQHSKDNGLSNFSAGVRHILHLYRQQMAKDAGLDLPEGEPT